VADGGYSIESSESEVGCSGTSYRPRLGDDLSLILGEDVGVDLLELKPRRGVLRSRSVADEGDQVLGSMVATAPLVLAALREIRRLEILVRWARMALRENLGLDGAGTPAVTFEVISVVVDGSEKTSDRTETRLLHRFTSTGAFLSSTSGKVLAPIGASMVSMMRFSLWTWTRIGSSPFSSS
jgi:hypothetical protein